MKEISRHPERETLHERQRLISTLHEKQESEKVLSVEKANWKEIQQSV